MHYTPVDHTKTEPTGSCFSQPPPKPAGTLCAALNHFDMNSKFPSGCPPVALPTGCSSNFPSDTLPCAVWNATPFGHTKTEAAGTCPSLLHKDPMPCEAPKSVALPTGCSQQLSVRHTSSDVWS